MNKKGEAEIVGSKTLAIIISVLAIIILSYIIYRILRPVIG